ncbi:hypothetical protein [Clostridium sp. DL1XJH146]
MQLIITFILFLVGILGCIVGFSYVKRKNLHGTKLWIVILINIIFIVITLLSMFYIIATLLLLGGID